MSAEINVGSIASAEAGVVRVDADTQRITLSVTRADAKDGRRDPTGNPNMRQAILSPALARGLAQLLNAAADRAEQ